ncbi:MAG: hypothetical protein ACREMY_31615 [bacterium]
MLFTVRQDLLVDAELEDACQKYDRTQDAWDMILWVLARDPTVGYPLSEGGTVRSFVFEGSWAHEMPTIQIIHVFEDPYVTIKSAIFRDPRSHGGTA